MKQKAVISFLLVGMIVFTVSSIITADFISERRELAQPSGEEFTALIEGDEFFHAVEVETGEIIKQEDDS
jgi:hypothetical protein